MNLLEKAKVITTPTAYSDGILHSVKPNVLENLVLQSNQFDTTWSGFNGASGQLGYDGSNDAWRYDSSSSVLRLQQLQGYQYSSVRTYSIYAKYVDTQWIMLQISGAANESAWFDVQNGVLGGLLVGFDSSITSVGNGWYRCTISGATANQDRVRLFVVGNNGSGTNIDGSVLIQDAQLNKGYSADQYIETTTETSPRADFTFTRNSSATRVGEDGYIQDVQIIGGELVQNGDFEEIGSELVTNGSFDTDSDWQTQTGWSISNGKANAISAPNLSRLTQLNLGQNINRPYKITFTVSNLTEGNFKVWFGAVQSDDILNDGDYVIYLTPTTTQQFFIYADGITTGSIDNVSVKEVGQNWVFNNGASMGDGVATIIGDGSAFGYIEQTNIFESGKTYKINLDVVINSGLGLKVMYGVSFSNLIGNMPTSGNYTFYYTASANNSIIIGRDTGGTAYDSSVDNVSVKEITDDTDLPRINYEGFTYAESLGDNLLSDPVNLVTDFLTNSGGVIVDSNTFTTSGGSLDGIKKTFLTIGKRYKLIIEGSTTSSGFAIGNLSVSGNEYGSGFGIHYFTAASTGLWIRQVTAGTTDITSFKVQEVIGDLPVPYSGVGSWLFEPQRTNEVTYSEDFSQWILQDGASVTSNVVFSPSGNLDAYLIDLSSTTDSRVVNNIGVTSTQYTLSFYLKKHQNDSNGTFPLAYYDGSNYIKTYVDLTDQWQRFSITFNTASEIIGYGLSRKGTTSDETLTRCYAWGAQLEQGSYPTSIIPTSGTAVTRLADVCNNAGNSDLFDSEGVLYAEIAALANDGTNRAISIDDGSLNNSINLFYAGNVSDNSIRALVLSGGGTQASMDFTLNVTDNHKIAIKYKNNDFALWVDGIEVVTDINGSVPVGLNNITFNQGGGTSNFYGKTKMVAVFPYLSNDEMECLTSEGYGSFQAMALANNYTII